MYALGNVEKFVADHATELGDKAEGILKRARALADGEILVGGTIKEVMGDETLGSRFVQVITTNTDHVAIGVGAILRATTPQWPR